jgi:lipopolysaccharide export LptBFGC system permease protein LptF
MKRLGLLISKYLLFAVLPYFIFSWLLLSVILFLQQASRFSDIFFNVNLPTGVVWQLTVALIPNVIAFTCPMAILVGTVIGLAKMQSDSELVAVRAAGVGNLQITIPLAVLGIILSIFAFFVNLKGVPIAAAMVRRVTLETALKKLESPVEPGTFNSEIAGYTIFVRNGDPESGRWKNIFIFKEDAAQGNVRLITADQGRIDFSDQVSELVLENAIVTTLPMEPGAGSFASENLGEIRFAIKTRRNELIQRLSQSGGSIEELGLEQLSDYANDNEGKERKEAQILWQRRILLSITPFLFTLLGTSMTLRFSRGGRGLGILLALLALISYYLLAFFGEQLARTGYASPMAEV